MRRRSIGSIWRGGVPDPKIAVEAGHARNNLRPAVELFRTTAWFYPLFSTRWHDQFGYAQVKTELRSRFPIKPYVSVRFVGDTRETIGTSSAARRRSISRKAHSLWARGCGQTRGAGSRDGSKRGRL